MGKRPHKTEDTQMGNKQEEVLNNSSPSACRSKPPTPSLPKRCCRQHSQWDVLSRRWRGSWGRGRRSSGDRGSRLFSRFTLFMQNAQSATISITEPTDLGKKELTSGYKRIPKSLHFIVNVQKLAFHVAIKLVLKETEHSDSLL